MNSRRNSEEASSSYLPSPEAITSRKFDVFLSFRGDIRDKFTSHLYERLTSVGIRVFKDDVQMVQGESINEALKTAINNSRICIPIFSNNYASSKACLQELSHMVLKHKSIIPIFYDVGADDVKLKTGLYKKPLEDHHREGKVGKEEIEKWEKALLRVGKILGYNIVNKNEADEITKITGQLLNQLMDEHQKDTNDTVEIEDEVEYVMKMLDLNSDGCHIIGLWGMGGIGKTTLAKVVFNRLSANFNNCCTFIANVRESVQNQQLLMLRRQLYKDLIDQAFANSIDDDDKGIKMIEKGLENKKFLVVLDDVDDKNVLKNIVGDHFQLANGSRIIITTRDKGVLDALENDFIQQSSNNQALVKVYPVQQLDDNRALQLFSKCAFKKDSPPDKFKILSKNIISSLGGLPLALKVFGSSLCGCSKKAWNDLIERLKETPDKEIETSLMISYHDLHEEEKKIFLDIACYPGNLEKTGAYYMWKSCGWHPNLSLDNLINKSLVKVESTFWKEYEVECLWMHDVLKDLGRNIIQEKCKKNGRELKKFLQISGSRGSFGKIPNEERKYVEMLQIDSSWVETITSNDLIGFENVRFLKLDLCKIKGNFEGLFPNLRWITINNVWRFKAANFNPKKLVVLQLRHPSVEVINLWWRQMKAHKLKVLEIFVDGSVERTQSFKELASLKVLTLRGCSQLVNSMRELEDSIGNLVSLCELDLSYTAIKVLPDSIGQLKQLEILRISGCQIRKFPPTIGNLMKLKELEAAGCKNFKGDIPSKIGLLSRLRILDFKGTPICRMQKLPSSLTHLLVNSAARYIKICSSSMLELINVVKLELWCDYLNVHSDQVYPKRLDFGWICRSSLLKELYLRIPYVISGLESVNGLSRLEKLALSFVEFQDHLQLPSKLSSLKLHDCMFPSGILDVSNAKKLKRLDISRCDMREIRGLTEMDSLETLQMSGLRNLSSLRVGSPDMFSRLEKLDLLFFEFQDHLQLPSKLSSLELHDCMFPSGILDVSNAKKLKRLDISRCDMHEIRGLTEMDSLETLQVSGLRNLSSLRVGSPDMFSRLDYLTHFSIKDLGIHSLNLVACGKLESIKGLDGLESLTDLSIEDCPSLRNLPDLSMLVNLRSLILCKLERLGCIKGLTQLKFLKKVNITGCHSLELDPDDLCRLNNAKSVLITDCDKLPCLFKNSNSPHVLL